MAEYLSLPITAGADLSAAQYKAVTIAGTVAATTLTTGGILQHKPQNGENASVVVMGRTPAVAGGAVTRGNQLTVTTSGYLVVASSGDNVCGHARETVTSGSIFDAFVNFGQGYKFS